MKRNPGYLLQNIAGMDYLLPYGQLIADHKRGISFNETGVFIWNLLEKEMSCKALLSIYLEHFLEDDFPANRYFNATAFDLSHVYLNKCPSVN